MGRDIQMRKTSVWPLALAVVFGLAGSAQGGKTVASHAQADSLDVPERASQLRNPYAGDLNAVLAGKKLFKRYCTECHGGDGDRLKNAPDLGMEETKEAPPGTIFWIIRNGNLKEGMPSWSRLPEERIWQIVSYLQRDE